MTKFFELPRPYSDCVVVNFKDAAMAIEAAGKIRSVAADNSLIVHELRHSSPETLVVYGKQARLVQRNGGSFLFSGFGRIGSRFVFGDTDLSYIVDRSDISGEVGQFTYFAVNKDSVEAECDLLGHGHLFASQHDGFAVIGNRLHLHTLVLRALGLKLELNDGPALSLLFSSNTFFSQQAVSHHMLSQGVSLVPVDKRAAMTGGLLTFRRKLALEYAVTGSPKDYDYLLDAGVQEVIENTRAVLESPDFGDIVVDLTGGKDSRLVFGSALHVPNWQSRIALNSTDVVNSQDLPIACGIANHFGARFYRGPSLPQSPVSAEDNLTIWRSYFHGLYHRIGAAAWTYGGRNTDAISLSGGSGEILRTFWHDNLRRHVLPEDDVSSFSMRFARTLGKERAFADDRLETVGNHLASALGELPGATLGDKLESHYLFFRNRAHFGLRGFSFYHEHATWFPLMSASLLKAAHSLPFAERASGRVIRDAMERINPILLGMPFDGKGIEGNDAPQIVLDTDRSAWESATKERAERQTQGRTGQQWAMSWATWTDYVLDETIRAHEEAQQISSVYRDLTPPGFVDLVRNEFATKSRFAMTTASTLFAIRDAIG